ncbi:MAG: hypothetical protein AAF743_07750 [Planctomycetota bacterium]
MSQPETATTLLRGATVFTDAPADGVAAEAFADRLAVVKDTADAIHVALPTMNGDEVAAVTVLEIGKADGAAFGAEVWAKEPHRSELGLVQSAYTGLDRLAAISPLVKFPLGAGLPGTVWQTCRPGLVLDLPNAEGFLRTTDANHGQLHAGLGWPLIYADRLAAGIVVLLSTDTHPLCRGVALWHFDETADKLTPTASTGTVTATAADVQTLVDDPTPVSGERFVMIPTRRAGRLDSVTVLEI